ncbi:response regulator [Balneatrix alpica]|uniref:Response regulator n=1 Tax=Balneatrix alpica TaxID=75684 RepID=A0ABV5ZAN1_9GAMM|nr:response regulator [Balneatrix alpica]
MKRMLTTGEVANYCGVNFRTVIRWIERGQLKAFKLPGRGDNRISLDNFIDFLHAHQMPVPQELQDSSRRVLIIEDEQPMAHAIERILKRAGMETRVVTDSFQAGSQLYDFNPSLVTLDLQMPGLNGMGVIEYIRSDERWHKLRILVVSAMSEYQLQQALDAGADAVLPKPFENQELVNAIDILLDQEALLSQ